jgi:hypothetical protein
MQVVAEAVDSPVQHGYSQLQHSQQQVRAEKNATE